MERDFHGYRKRYESAMKKLKADEEITEQNKKLILDFLSYCKIENGKGISIGRIARYAYVLIKLAKWLGKDFDKTDRKDIERLVGVIQDQSNFKDWTKHLYKVSIKKFYKWLNGGEEYPTSVRWIKCNFRNSNKMLPEELLTQEEVKKMIEVAEHPRDKAFLAVLYESGCRIGEMMGLCIKHVVFDEYGAQIVVDGKTGPRRVRLIASVPYLSSWMNCHPKKARPEGPLWVCIGTTHHGGMMQYKSLISLLNSVAQKAGIMKNVNPQRWRQSRATHLAPHLKEFQMDMYFGWVLGSDMPRTYVHMSGRDIDDSLLEMYGKKKPEDGKKDVLTPKSCQICKHDNEATSDFCNRCGKPLEIKTMIEMEDKRDKDAGLVVKMLESPNVLEQFIKNSDERTVEEIINAHPKLAQKIVSIAVKNVRA